MKKSMGLLFCIASLAVADIYDLSSEYIHRHYFDEVLHDSLTGIVFFVMMILSCFFFFRFNLKQKHGLTIKTSFTAKEKCDFCNELFNAGPIKIMTFTFMGDAQYQCCQSCFNKASKNDMRITSLQMIKDYIVKESIESANDQRLRNFFGAQIYQHGLWLTINNYDFFTNSNLGLKPSSFQKKSSLTSNETASHEDTSCFWTSYVVAELTHSPIAGYAVGRSFLGAILGSSGSSNSGSFGINDIFSEVKHNNNYNLTTETDGGNTSFGDGDCSCGFDGDGGGGSV